jgi:NADH-quinone oxidoreductase subunit L
VLALPPVGDTVVRALGEEPVHPTPLEMAASAVIALLVLGLVWWRPGPEPGWARGWVGLERATQTSVVRPTLALAEALARFDDRILDRGVTASAAVVLDVGRRVATFDDRVLDGAVEATSRVSMRAAERAGRDDDRWLDGAVEGFSAQMRKLGRLARRPQTGQLHQYYIQTAAVLAVGVLLLVLVR